MEVNPNIENKVDDGIVLQNCHQYCVSEKEILNLSWNYFQQHAQQRLSFFNFFVVFAVLATTGLISTLQEEYNAHSIGIAVGLMLSLISFIFYKIDERNKYLTKTGENAIRQIEKNYSCVNCYPDKAEFQIFSIEEEETKKLRMAQKKKSIIYRQISHSKSFNLIFIIFFIIGILGAATSVYFQYNSPGSKQKLLENRINTELLAISNQLVELLRSNTALNKELINQLQIAHKTDELKDKRKTPIVNASSKSN